MDAPLTISLVAPVYGVEKYISRFAESVLGQSYPHIQFIFVNDGTKDRSIELLNELIDSRFQHLRERITIVGKENGGLPAARRTGMEYVSGDYVWHIDSDDWLEPDAVKRIAECALATGSDLIYFNFYKEYAGRTKLKVEADYRTEDKTKYIKAMYNHRSYGCVWNKCVKTGLYRKYDIRFPQYSYAEDIFLMAQITGYAESIYHLDEALYHYRKDNPQAITRQNRRKRRAEAVRNSLALYELYKDVPSDKCPVSVLFDDIFYRSGLYSLMYGLGLFEEFPYLSDNISRASLHRGGDVWIPMQLLLKLYAFIRRFISRS